MKKRRLTSLILILLIIFVSIGLFYTNAKYTSKVSGKANASVARYAFNVTATDSYNSTDTIDNLTLAQTCDEKTLVNGKIAPGTEGSFDIIIDASGAEVGINYEVTFSNNSEHALPQNLILTLDGKKWSFDEKIKGSIYANAENKIINRTVLWSWPYETADDEGNTIIGDTADTNDGKNAFDYSFIVTATGTQSKPLLEGEEPEPVHEHNYDNLIGKTIVNNKVYCDDDCDGIDVTIVVKDKTVKINDVVYNISNNVIVDKHTVHTYEGATLTPNGSNYKVACTECGKETIATTVITGKTVDINGTVYTISGNTVGNKYEHEHNYDNLIGKTIIGNKVYCSDDCDGIDVTIVVKDKTVKINDVVYNISNNVIVDKHTVHTYEGATLTPNGSNYKVACTECGKETIATTVITGKTVDINGTVYTISGNTVGSIYNHEHNYNDLIGKTITNSKIYCNDNCDGINVTVVVSGKTVAINGIIYNVSNNVIQSKHEIHTYEGATLIQNGDSYKVSCTECGTEIIGIIYENNGEVTINGNTYSVTEEKVIGNKITSYVVKHWQQNVNGTASSHNSINYTLKDTQNLKGEIGKSITPLTKTYTGFNSPLSINTTIKADGTTEVNYYYTRKSYTVTLNKGTGISSTSIIGKVSGTNKSKYLYGETVTINATVSAGYTWLNWDGSHKVTTQNYTFTIPSTNVSDTANAKANTNTQYTVNYWQQKVGGIADQHNSTNYAKYESKTYTGTTDTTIIAKLKEYDGFITPEEQSVTILGNGNAVVDYYYEKDPRLTAFITEWTLTNNNMTITLPIAKTPNITVDWGDGSTEKITSTTPTHTYSKSGTYNISINGNLPIWSFQYALDNINYITGIKQWGEVGFTTMETAFHRCDNLKGALPEPTEHSFENVVSFRSCFTNTAITSVPDNFFSNCPKLTDLNSTFDNCKNLRSIKINTPFISDKMFYQCANITNITIGDNVKSIGTEAFKTAAWSATKVKTTVTTNNSLARNYNWTGDYRTVTFKSL